VEKIRDKSNKDELSSILEKHVIAFSAMIVRILPVADVDDGGTFPAVLGFPVCAVCSIVGPRATS